MEQASSFEISLAGKHAFSTDDDASFAREDHDSNDWDTISVPGLWNSAGVHPNVYIAWYRIKFTTPDQLPDEPLAIELGLVYFIDETYLNGVQIGGEGEITEHGPMHRVFPPHKYRAYRIPEGLLKPGQENVLAIRVARRLQEGGIANGPVRVTLNSEAQSRASAVQTRYMAIDYALVGMDIVMLLICIAALMVNIRSALFFSCVIFWIVYTSGWTLTGRLFYEAGFATPTIHLLAYMMLSSFGVITIVDFYTRSLRRAPHYPLRYVSAAMVISTIFGSLADPMSSNIVERIISNAVWIWAAGFIVSFGWLSWMTFKAVWQGEKHALPLGVSIFAVLIAALFDWFFPASAFQVWTGLNPMMLASRFVFVCMGISFGLRFLETDRRFRVASKHVLQAQEEERRRLARDIHDSTGQKLSIAKLQLQMLRKKMQQSYSAAVPEIDRVIESSNEAIHDLRDMSHDLSPSLMGKVPLDQLIAAHNDRISSLIDIQLTSHLEPTPLIQSHVKDHLYRIFQEAMKNAVQHSGAKKITVRLSMDAQYLKLTVADDGRGFSSGDGTKNTDGLGLQSIQERVDLIEGRVVFESKEKFGTTVEILVPKAQLIESAG